jgi:uncharacterized protein DUF3352
VDFDRDVRPVLGNDFVIGATDARSFTDDSDDDNFVGAIEAKDGDKLEALVKKGSAREDGEKSGAQLYRDKDRDSFAVNDDVLIVAGSKRVLEDALERRDGDGHLTEDDFDQALESLPSDALARVYLDVESPICRPRRGAPKRPSAPP